MTAGSEFTSGRPVVFRHATVLTMDNAHKIERDADVLVVDDKIAAVGPQLEAPADAVEIDATDLSLAQVIDLIVGLARARQVR